MELRASSWLKYLWHRMWLKHEGNSTDLRTDLIRCLSTWQLTLLGLGNTIGVGIYVLLGVMVKEEAGPSVIFSFLIAIVVTWMNAMVFAEFSTYVPQTGASYIFVYKVFGEFTAFLIGSLTICSGLLCGSVGARAWSGMLDSFFNNTLQDHTVALLGKIELGPPFAEKLDIVAFLFQAVITVVVLFNILCTSVINTVLGVLTSSVLIFVFFAGMIFGDWHTFLNSEHGGFFPFGAVGVVRAASMALYAMSGFEIISMSSEESKNPAKSIPRAMVAELAIVGLIYIGAAVGMMFLIPYWMVDLRAPLPSALEHSGLPLGKLFVTVGPMFGITNLQMLGLYGLSRSIYRMSKDGLIVSFFLSVDEGTGVPRRAVMFSGVLTSVFALVCDLSYIVKMSLILMLISYISAAAALICLKVGEKDGAAGRAERFRNDDGYSLFTDGDEETLFSREDVHDSKTVVSPDFEENNNPDKQSLKETSMFLSNPVEDFDSLEAFEKNALEENGKPFSPFKSGQFSTNQIPSDHNLEGKNNSDGNGSLIASTGETQELSVEEESFVIQKGGKSSTSPSVALTTRPFPDVPTKLLLWLHLVTCVTLSAQVIYGQGDILALRPVAVLACTMLTVLLVLFSSLLWLVHSRSQWAPRSDQLFQTPVMPLVPTCSIVLSSMMLFSAAEKIGSVEILVMTAMVTLLYILMTVADFKSKRRTNAKHPALPEDREQEMRLISPDSHEDEQYDDDDGSE
ncbi:hypothetical protein EGW08_009365 [Elysia chlorotica]|uniref:Cationic amino acid transporter C-terminal domain-containing protein n=1 Tax=Elysia chlorotica TaxID=188477 RepID=A0A433TMP0_ELYCH|nr:hypothetical protein EGW08_009365 [Elysia chlorotica]